MKQKSTRNEFHLHVVFTKQASIHTDYHNQCVYQLACLDYIQHGFTNAENVYGISDTCMYTGPL